jgi:hypothetical protein
MILFIDDGRGTCRVLAHTAQLGVTHRAEMLHAGRFRCIVHIIDVCDDSFAGTTLPRSRHRSC